MKDLVYKRLTFYFFLWFLSHLRRRVQLIKVIFKLNSPLIYKDKKGLNYIKYRLSLNYKDI